MENNKDFKNIWKQQKVGQPNFEELQLKSNKFKRSNLLKIIFANIILVALSAFAIFIWCYYQPQYITTKIGIVLLIVAMGFFVFSYTKLFTLFNKIDDTQTSTEYLKNLTAIKIKQKFVHTTLLSLYSVLVSIAMCLYLFEYASLMEIQYAILVYALTIAWILFNWFYIRPKTIKKQQVKLDELINNFENLNQQLK